MYYIILGILLSLLFSYLCLDVHYYLRVVLCVLSAKVMKKRTHLFEETSISGICLTTDIDTLFTHMNNARFLRELDFAKVDYYQRTGLYQVIRKHGGRSLLRATTIRYRRFIKLFSRYILTTKIIYWDEQSIYMEHRFISQPDKFVNAIVLCIVKLANCDQTAESILKEVLSTYSCANSNTNATSNGKDAASVDIEKTTNSAISLEKPPLSPELEKWIESNEISSVNLKNNM